MDKEIVVTSETIHGCSYYPTPLARCIRESTTIWDDVYDAHYVQTVVGEKWTVLERIFGRVRPFMITRHIDSNLVLINCRRYIIPENCIEVGIPYFLIQNENKSALLLLSEPVLIANWKQL